MEVDRQDVTERHGEMVFTRICKVLTCPKSMHRSRKMAKNIKGQAAKPSSPEK